MTCFDEEPEHQPTKEEWEKAMKARQAIDNPRNLTPHQMEVEEAAGMPLDWGLNAAYTQGRTDAIRDYADLSTNSANVNQATPGYLNRLEQIKNHLQMYEDFVREVLGWGFPQWQGDVLYHMASDGTRSVFAPLQVENVLKWVECWCSARNMAYKISFQPYGNITYNVDIENSGCGSDYLCVALIAACLKAARELAQSHVVQP